jgi:hypothetical protein
MILINSVADAQQLLDLALEVQELEMCHWREALGRAIHLTPELEADVANDVRYESLPVHVSIAVDPALLPDPAALRRRVVLFDREGQPAQAWYD